MNPYLQLLRLIQPGDSVTLSTMSTASERTGNRSEPPLFFSYFLKKMHFYGRISNINASWCGQWLLLPHVFLWSLIINSPRMYLINHIYLVTLYVFQCQMYLVNDSALCIWSEVTCFEKKCHQGELNHNLHNP